LLRNCHCCIDGDNEDSHIDSAMTPPTTSPFPQFQKHFCFFLNTKEVTTMFRTLSCFNYLKHQPLVHGFKRILICPSSLMTCHLLFARNISPISFRGEPVVFKIPYFVTWPPPGNCPPPIGRYGSVQQAVRIIVQSPRGTRTPGPMNPKF